MASTDQISGEKIRDINGAFGLLAWLEKTRIRLPLRGVECRFEVCGDVASVQMEQIFHQTNAQPLNCTYSFPLPGNAAVYRCEVEVGGRVIRAVVKEAKEARQIYEEKVAAGHRAALVETERENLFTLSLGNLQPKDLVVVKLAYYQTLDRVGRQLSLMIPFCPGVRYIPGQPLLCNSKGQGTVGDTDQVPDASRITPPRIKPEHEDAAYANIEGTVSGCDLDLATVTSPLHKIHTEQAADTLSVRIDMQSAIPDRDFVLRWEEKESTDTRVKVWMWQQENEAYAVARIKAPERVQTQQDFEQDHYFLVDRSGSMQGAKWEKTAEALVAFVRRLGEKDRVWITLFESRFQDFAETPMSKRELLRDKGFLQIARYGTAGGTELLPALKHVLQRIQEFSTPSHRPANLILITDGQVGNEQAILNAMRAHGGLPVFAFGIDVTVNDAFLRNLTRQQNGEAVFQTPAEDIAHAVEALAMKLVKPVMTNLQVGGGWEPADTGLQNLYEGSVVDLTLRQVKPGPVQLSGILPDGRTHQFTLQPAATTNRAVKLLWVKNRITWFLDNDRSDDAIRLAIENNILCRGTSFIAWDDAEKVPVAGQELYQPSMEPRFMDQTRVQAEGLMACCKINSGPHIDYLMAAPDKPLTADRVGFIGKLRKSRARSAREVAFKLEPPDPNDPHRALRQGFEALPRFHSRVGLGLISGLLHWIDGEPDQRDARQRAVEKLLVDLLRCKDDTAAARKILSEFINREISKAESLNADLLALVSKL